MGRDPLGAIVRRMAYPGSFHRIVVIGSLYNAETFNFTLAVVSPEDPAQVEAVTPQLLNDVSAKIVSWWDNAYGSGGMGIMAAARLTDVKINRIASNGHYQDNEAMIQNVGTPVPGAGVGTAPAQIACAVTLRTALARGRGSRGRFYVPAPAVMTSLGTDGRLTTEQAGNLATGAAALLNDINTTYWARDGGLRVAMRVGVASDIGTGIFQPATAVEVGRVPDTIRSRRSSLSEDHQQVALLP
jgi:hypothetical protein